jgi:hypothetical protein
MSSGHEIVSRNLALSETQSSPTKSQSDFSFPKTPTQPKLEAPAPSTILNEIEQRNEESVNNELEEGEEEEEEIEEEILCGDAPIVSESCSIPMARESSNQIEDFASESEDQESVSTSVLPLNIPLFERNDSETPLSSFTEDLGTRSPTKTSRKMTLSPQKIDSGKDESTLASQNSVLSEQQSLSRIASKDHLLKHEEKYIPNLPAASIPIPITGLIKPDISEDYDDLESGDNLKNDALKRRYSLDENADAPAKKKKSKWLDLVMN